MNRMNRGALTDLRHIIFDVIGNFLAYLITRVIFTGLIGRHDISLENTFMASCLFVVIYILIGKDVKLYNTTTFYYPDRVIRSVFMGSFVAAAAVFTVFYLTGRASTNRGFYVTYTITAVLILSISSFLSFTLNRRNTLRMRTLMIGTKESFEKFNRYIQKTNVLHHPMGYVLLRRNSGGVDHDWRQYLGCVESGDLDQILRDHIVDQVYIMQEPGSAHLVRLCTDTCMELGVVTRLVHPETNNDSAAYISSVGTYPVITYHINDLNTCAQAVKRVMDICGALVGIVLSLPILIVAAVAIKMDSEGPVFFKQTRVGLNGRRFQIYKLRTMTTDAEFRKAELMAFNEIQGGLMFKIQGDPRITRVGEVLRRTSIDEIPQFFNVLNGSMSLVGTRPPTEDEVRQYENSHWRRLRIKPGITGMWQCSGRSQIHSFDEIVELDTKYIENWSIWSDIRLILKTVAVVLKRKGAY